MSKDSSQGLFDIYIPMVIVQVLLYGLLLMVSSHYLSESYQKVIEKEALELINEGKFDSFDRNMTEKSKWVVNVVHQGESLYLSKDWSHFFYENRSPFKLFIVLTFLIVIVNIKLLIDLLFFRTKKENRIIEYLDADEDKKFLMENRNDFYKELRTKLLKHYDDKVPHQKTSEPDYNELISNLFDQFPFAVYVEKSHKNLDESRQSHKVHFANEHAVKTLSMHSYLGAVPLFQQNPQLLEKDVLGEIGRNIPCIVDRKKSYYFVYKLKVLDKNVWFLLNTFETFVFESRKIIYNKLAAVTDLATGMAHELNNPLSIVLSGVQNLLRYTDIQNPKNRKLAQNLEIDPLKLQQYFSKLRLDKIVDGIEDSSSRMARIVWKILGLKKKEHLDFRAISPLVLAQNAVMVGLADITAKNISDNLVVVKDFQEDMPLIYCRAYEFEFAVLEIIKNALWALAQSDDEKKVLMFRCFHQNNQVIFEIVDNGVGVDPLYHNRVFDPFFTLKPAGEGIGLGLYISHFILQCQHQAQVSFYSEPNHGTKVIIGMPVNK